MKFDQLTDIFTQKKIFCSRRHDQISIVGIKVSFIYRIGCFLFCWVFGPHMIGRATTTISSVYLILTFPDLSTPNQLNPTSSLVFTQNPRFLCFITVFCEFGFVYYYYFSFRSPISTTIIQTRIDWIMFCCSLGCLCSFDHWIL